MVDPILGVGGGGVVPKKALESAGDRAGEAVGDDGGCRRGSARGSVIAMTERDCGLWRWWRRRRPASGLQEHGLADRERILGPDHPDTLRAPVTLAGVVRVGGAMDASPMA